jgi:rRNA-processing protein FCF1
MRRVIQKEGMLHTKARLEESLKKKCERKVTHGQYIRSVVKQLVSEHGTVFMLFTSVHVLNTIKQLVSEHDTVFMLFTSVHVLNTIKQLVSEHGTVFMLFTSVHVLNTIKKATYAQRYRLFNKLLSFLIPQCVSAYIYTIIRRYCYRLHKMRIRIVKWQKQLKMFRTSVKPLCRFVVMLLIFGLMSIFYLFIYLFFIKAAKGHQTKN